MAKLGVVLHKQRVRVRDVLYERVGVRGEGAIHAHVAQPIRELDRELVRFVPSEELGQLAEGAEVVQGGRTRHVELGRVAGDEGGLGGEGATIQGEALVESVLAPLADAP